MKKPWAEHHPRSPEAQEGGNWKVPWRLIEEADGIAHYDPKGLAAHLDFGCAAVRSRRPNIVYATRNTDGSALRRAGVRSAREQDRIALVAAA